MYLGLGVSICLDVVSIETLDLDISKSWSRPSRKSRRFSKVSLDDRDKVSTKSRRSLDWSRRFLCYKISICLDFYFCLDRDSRSRRQKKVSLDRRENLDGFQKLVSTRRTFSISISIGLDVETPKLKWIPIKNLLRATTKAFNNLVSKASTTVRKNWFRNSKQFC